MSNFLVDEKNMCLVFVGEPPADVMSALRISVEKWEALNFWAAEGLYINDGGEDT